MSLFRKKTKAVTVIPEKRAGGIFSTHSDLGRGFTEHERQKVVESLDRNIQRGKKKEDFTHQKTIIQNDDGTTSVMDEAYPDLQLVKLQNSYGGDIAPAQMIWYANQSFIGYQTAAILSQNWLINKACAMPARDAVRHGYDVTINDGSEIKPAVLDYIRKRDKAFKLKENCAEFVTMERKFGIRIALFEVDSTDPLYYELPFNIDGVVEGSYRGISQVDPYWITPELDANAAANPASKHFYEPTWWRINGKRVHRTHLIIGRNGDDLPDILKPTYFYGGIPTPQKIAERVFAAERTANEAPMLAMTKRLISLKTDITEAEANGPQFIEKMTFWSALMNNFGIKIIGENEELDQKDTSLNDLDAVIMTQYQLVAAAAEVPATKLLGTSPKGFGASGEYEESSYHEFLESIQENDLSPLVNRHHALLIKSEVMKKFSIPFFETEVAWKPTDTPTDKEQAEIQLLKAQRDMALIQGGSIDGTDSRQRIVADPDSDYNGIAAIVPDGPGDREAQQEAEAALEQPVNQSNRGKSTQEKESNP